MLVGADDTASDKMHGPIEVACGVARRLERGQDALPDAGQLPAPKPAVHGLPAALRLGQGAPGRTGLQAPEDASDDAAVVEIGAPGTRFGRRKQGRQLLPLAISEGMAIHARSVSPLCKHALAQQQTALPSSRRVRIGANDSAIWHHTMKRP